MEFEKMKSAGFLTNHMARLFAKGLQERIKPLGITIGQLPLLLELWETDGITQKILVHSLDIEQATIANTLNRMERDNLIHRKQDPTDGRIQQIWLTPQASELRDQTYAAAKAQNAEALSGLSIEEQTQFLSYMDRIIKTMR